MVRFNMRKAVAVLAAVATLGVAGPVAVSAAQAADDTQTAHSCVKQHQDGLATVTFCNPDGTIIQAVAYGADDSVPFSTFAIGQDANVQAPAGKVFDHWAYTDSTTPVDPAMPVSLDIAVYPVFKDAPAEFTVRFHYAGKDGKEEVLNADNMTASIAFSAMRQFADKQAAQTLPAGKVLAGWTAIEDGKDLIPDGATFDAANGAYVDVYAKYADAKFTVRFHYAGKDGKEEVLNADDMTASVAFSTMRQFADQQAAQTLPAGKVLAGWTAVKDGGELVADSATFKAATDVWAVYKDAEPAKQAVVSFYNADQSPIQTVGYDAGTQKFSVYAAGIEPTVVPEGKVFAGWAFASDSGDVAVDPDEVVNADWAVYATFKDAPKPEEDKTEYTVSFHEADGTLIQTVSYYAKDKVTFGQYSLGIQAKELAGKTFAGWVLADGTPAEADAVVTANTDVYASYKTVPAPQPQYPWWANWWTAFQHWWGSWNHWFGGWWR